MKDFLRPYMANPVFACGAIFLTCVFALFSAYVAEFAFGLEPCALCLLQRWPFFIAGALSIVGLGLLYNEEWVVYSWMVTAACAVVFFLNGLLASYHVGVEQHFWKSALEGCTVDFDPGSMDQLMALFDNKPAARCDEVPWSFLGISMAGYNALLCYGMAALCFWSTRLLRGQFDDEYL